MSPIDSQSLLIQSRSCLVQEAWFHSQRPWDECRGFWLHPDSWACSGTGRIVMLNPHGVRVVGASTPSGMTPRLWCSFPTNQVLVLVLVPVPNLKCSMCFHCIRR
ncbi:hypothetical protein PO909_019456 [Leuciscus waleckii]